MGKNSQKRDALRKAKRQEWERLQQLKKNEVNSSSGLIPATAPLNAGINELHIKHMKEENYKLIFATYNYKECELNLITNTKDIVQLIKLFNRITECSPKNLPSSGIVRDKIESGKKYSRLFQTVPPDAELLEAGFANEGRLFFYIINTYFCIVAIKIRHIS